MLSGSLPAVSVQCLNFPPSHLHGWGNGISGSAPLSSVVLDFLRCVIGNVVVEGYGATETAGATLLQLYNDYTSGNVGGPMSCCDMRLEDVPDMEYLHTDKSHNGLPCIGRGELCMRVSISKESDW